MELKFKILEYLQSIHPEKEKASAIAKEFNVSKTVVVEEVENLEKHELVVIHRLLSDMNIGSVHPSDNAPLAPTPTPAPTAPPVAEPKPTDAPKLSVENQIANCIDQNFKSCQFTVGDILKHLPELEGGNNIYQALSKLRAAEVIKSVGRGVYECISEAVQEVETAVENTDATEKAIPKIDIIAGSSVDDAVSITRHEFRPTRIKSANRIDSSVSIVRPNVQLLTSAAAIYSSKDGIIIEENGMMFKLDAKLTGRLVEQMKGLHKLVKWTQKVD